MGSASSVPADAIPDPDPLPGSPADQEELREALDGRLYTFQDVINRDHYNQMRAGANGTETWNHDGMGKPIAIAGCESKEDVSAAIKYAKKHCQPAGIKVCVAGGRHSHQCMVNNSFVIDLSGLKGITINEEANYADVMGGALQGDLDTACEPYHLATTAGHVASTGCGGLIIQGGHGYLERKFGMVVDNLLQIEIVIADGSIVVADSTQNQDLFWAIRGGGGNFGVVVRFRLKLHPIPNKIYAGQRIHVPLGKWWFPDRAPLIQAFSKVTAESTDDNATGLLVLPCGGPVVEILVYVGEVEEGQQYFAQHKKNGVGCPLVDNMKGQSYWTGVQRFAPAGGGNFYLSGVLVPKMTDDFSSALGDCVTSANSPGKNTNSLIFLLPMGGAVARKQPEDCANPHRSPLFWVLIQGEWQGTPGTPEYEERRGRVVAWTSFVKTKLQPFAMGHYGVLAEVDTHGQKEGEEEDTDKTGGVVGDREPNTGFVAAMQGGKRNVYGPNLPRLQTIKKKYDPTNLFTINDNILPK